LIFSPAAATVASCRLTARPTAPQSDNKPHRALRPSQLVAHCLNTIIASTTTTTTTTTTTFHILTLRSQSSIFLFLRKQIILFLRLVCVCDLFDWSVFLVYSFLCRGGVASFRNSIICLVTNVIAWMVDWFGG